MIPCPQTFGHGDSISGANQDAMFNPPAKCLQFHQAWTTGGTIKRSGFGLGISEAQMFVDMKRAEL
jgi:hypothetical protein